MLERRQIWCFYFKWKINHSAHRQRINTCRILGRCLRQESHQRKQNRTTSRKENLNFKQLLYMSDRVFLDRNLSETYFWIEGDENHRFISCKINSIDYEYLYYINATKTLPLNIHHSRVQVSLNDIARCEAYLSKERISILSNLYRQLELGQCKIIKGSEHDVAIKKQEDIEFQNRPIFDF